MKRYLVAAAAACLVTSALAQTFTDGDLVVVLRSEPCAEIVPLMVLSTVTDKEPSRADLTYKGQEIAACWVEKGDRIFISDENGTAGYIEKSEFK